MKNDLFSTSQQAIDCAPAWSFLRSIYPARLFSSSPVLPEEAPFVTLTYAQSLDAKIAGKDGEQLILSGKESMLLTHRMRELHDSILVGAGTVFNDDPQLNARIPSLLPVSAQPNPIIIDRDLEATSVCCRLIRNAAAGTGKMPVIVYESLFGREVTPAQASRLRTRLELFNRHGVTTIEVRAGSDHKFHLEDLLECETLRPHLGRSLMIEGGCGIISSFLPSPRIDMVVTTVAPVFVGDGIPLFKPETQMPQLAQVKTQVFGKDTVFACKPVVNFR
ncbi:2,5-diamino-6-(ribosylamino)-4(3H)-pyrimidinone 5'-phosphate reductase [Sporobolomyces koalae]|uniref:2,5-diamino-6-(ribosylamino)-4(3H)-pyrimidinone 5'-phosphate reductase n=1 Tax=Sporobolomyces koalae TaxID=500713 RepID=UPI00317787FF